jgi:hypothetical protein
MRRSVLGCLLVGLLSVSALPAWGQDAQRGTVVSANPFGLLFDLFNAEVERAVSETATAGVGGSTFSRSGNRYLNADLFARYYVSGSAFEGWNLGVKIGLTSISGDGVSGSETAFGYGFDINRSWLVGATEQLYISTGVGLKRIIAGDRFVEYVPTLRIVNVGWRF